MSLRVRVFLDDPSPPTEELRRQDVDEEFPKCLRERVSICHTEGPAESESEAAGVEEGTRAIAEEQGVEMRGQGPPRLRSAIR